MAVAESTSRVAVYNTDSGGKSHTDTFNNTNASMTESDIRGFATAVATLVNGDVSKFNHTITNTYYPEAGGGE